MINILKLLWLTIGCTYSLFACGSQWNFEQDKVTTGQVTLKNKDGQVINLTANDGNSSSVISTAPMMISEGGSTSSYSFTSGVSLSNGSVYIYEDVLDSWVTYSQADFDSNFTYTNETAYQLNKTTINDSLTWNYELSGICGNYDYLDANPGFECWAEAIITYPVALDETYSYNGNRNVAVTANTIYYNFGTSYDVNKNGAQFSYFAYFEASARGTYYFANVSGFEEVQGILRWPIGGIETPINENAGTSISYNGAFSSSGPISDVVSNESTGDTIDSTIVYWHRNIGGVDVIYGIDSRGKYSTSSSLYRIGNYHATNNDGTIFRGNTVDQIQNYIEGSSNVYSDNNKNIFLVYSGNLFAIDVDDTTSSHSTLITNIPSGVTINTFISNVEIK